MRNPFPIAALALLAALPVSGALQGIVIDAATGRPIAGATVKFPSGSASAITDERGQYVLTPTSLGRPAPRPSSGDRARALAFGSRPSAATTFDVSGRLFPWDGPAPKVLFARSRVSQKLPDPSWAAGHAGPVLVARTADVPCLLVVETPTFKPREANCAEGHDATVAIVSESAARYYYRLPVSAGDGWEVGDLSAAVPQPKALLEGMDSLAARRYKEIHSLLVVKGGKLVLEEYYKGTADTFDFEKGIRRIPVGAVHWTRTSKHYVASVNKAITSILTGMALAKAGLSVTTSLGRLLPAYQAAFLGTKADITVEHALTMSMGFQWDEWSGRDLADMWAPPD
ncbi:MAG TPA: serine hydrolase, partial [Fibrobacteria bacterium]|nr:serine hydrolase [Fibrobacteria bacterium]